MPTDVFFIRHAQSAFNAAVEEIKQATAGLDQSALMTRFSSLREDPSLRDAPLSAEGHRQVAAAAAEAATLDVDLVLVSPLTRAVQTALGLFGTTGTPIEASPLHAERLFSICDVGRTPAELAAEFPGVGFSHLDDVWWHNDPSAVDAIVYESEDAFRTRVERFKQELAARPEARVAVVGHGLFFQEICGRHLDNCEIFPFAL